MSIRKELTAQNVLLGFQHVLVSNCLLYTYDAADEL